MPFSLHVDTLRRWGGGQRQVYELVLALREAGERAAVVAHPQGELFHRLRQGLDLFPLAPGSDVDIASAWTLSRIVKRLRPEVVHAHDSRAVAMAATALAIAAPTPRPALVATRRAEFRADRTAFSRWKYSQVDCFAATSETVRGQLLGDGVSAGRIAVVMPGLDVARIRRLPAVDVHAELFLPTHSPIVGCVAALSPQKGQTQLVDVAARVVREVPDARFVLVGEGGHRASIERHVHALGLDRHVLLAGFRTDAVELTKSFDVYVSAALREGASIAMLDAMAAGKPCVATACGSVPEVIVDGETGFVVPPKDTEAMAERVVRLLKDDRLRQRLGAAAAARADERFSVPRMVQETRWVYDMTLRRQVDARRAG